MSGPKETPALPPSTAPEPYVPIHERDRTCVVCGRTYRARARLTVTCSKGCGIAHRTSHWAQRQTFAIPESRMVYPQSAEAVITPEAETSVVLPDAPQVVPGKPEAVVRDFEPMAARTVPLPWVTPSPMAATGHTGRYQKVVFWSDTHIGDHSERMVGLALRYLEHFGPDLVIIMGDFLDAHGLAKWEHDPTEKAAQLQHELSIGHILLDAIQRATPKAERKFVRGNHENRLERMKWKTSSLVSLEALSLSNLLRLADFGFDPVVRDRIDLCQGELIVYHGEKYSSIPCNAARQELVAHMKSGVSGHDHTLVEVPLDSEGTSLRWYGCGYLGNNPPHYRPLRRQNWQAGLVSGYVQADGNAFDLHTIPFRPSFRCRVGSVELSA